MMRNEHGEMIVEVANKKTHEHLATHWNICGIEHDNNKYILFTEYGKENIVISSELFDLTISV